MTKEMLVTGGAGFIASHTVDLLVSKGYDIIILDNLSTGNKKNLNKKARFIQGDILNVDKYFKKLKNVDAVLHCAAQISVSSSLENPAKDANVNVIGSLKLLELCRRLGIKKFVFSSTAGVYGDVPKSKLPVVENYKLRPQNPYSIGKRTVEMYMDFYNKAYGMDCVSLRYSNVYGPRQNYLGEAGVVTIFINQLLNNKKPTIFGDGKQTRDFVYVADVAEANLKAIERKTSSKVMSIATGTQISINELLSKIKKLMHKNKIKAIHKVERKGDIRFSSLNIGVAKKELRWKPKTKLEEGLKETIEWFGGK